MIGTHEINLELPKGWKQKYHDQELIFTKVTAKICVTGHIITVEGELKKYDLVDATNDSIEKWQMKAKFPPPFGKHVVTELHSEEELEKYLTKRGGLVLLGGRLKLPRIRWAGSYWPPSEKALSKIQILVDDAINNEKEFDWTSLPFSEIEGIDLSAVDEPIWEGHPYEFDETRE